VPDAQPQIQAEAILHNLDYWLYMLSKGTF
jgi:hypothetical protein